MIIARRHWALYDQVKVKAGVYVFTPYKLSRPPKLWHVVRLLQYPDHVVLSPIMYY